MPALKRVGHKGADLIVPGNTAASFDAALEAGVDMIEFDVLRLRDGELVLAHDFEDAAGRPRVSLADGLDHLAGGRFEGIELDVDLKLPGYELAVVGALRERGLVERSLISSQYIESLRIIRAEMPELRLGLSVPKLRRDPLESRWLRYPAGAALLVARAILPRRAAAGIRAGRFDALMANWRLVTPALAQAVRAAGGELYVWTVDNVPVIARLQEMGVTGVITNDPRLFSRADRVTTISVGL
jgi:glycerophosphoryl diester phosphodiesterase